MEWINYKNRLEKIINHAKLNSPFYREIYSSIDTSSLSENKFKSLPIIKKEDFLYNEKKLLTIEISNNNLFEETTSGTSGKTLKCYKSNKERIKKAMDMWKFRKKHGNINYQDREVVFYPYFEGEDLIDDRIYIDGHELWIPITDMSPSSLETYFQAIVEFKPAWIFSEPSALNIFCSYLLDYQKDTKKLSSIRYIECAGEKFSDYQRRMIERVFGQIVYSMYASAEFWPIAITCKKNNYHILEDDYYIEVINVDENGVGEIVITDLYNETWPLIRYNQGDLVKAKFTNCDCGHHSPVIHIEGGRIQDYIRIGNWVSNPILFDYAINYVNSKYGDCIRQFRVYQLKEYYLSIEIIKGKDLNINIKEELRKLILNRTPDGTILEFIETNKIEYTGRKFTYFFPYDKQ